MKLVYKKAVIVIASATLSLSGLYAQAPIDNTYSKEFRKALSLYEAGMFSEAVIQFNDIYQKYSDYNSEGYAILCAETLMTPGYLTRVENYAKRYPYSGMLPEMYFRYGLNLFNEGKYATAAKTFDKIDVNQLVKKSRAEYMFKRAYCDFQLNEYDSALFWFEKVDKLKNNDFSAPARYASGYINYEQQHFTEALDWFNKAVKDPRFTEISKYYITECKFMLKDYKYVVDNGTKLYSTVPENRKPHLARIISESYLVLGKPEEAKVYYDTFKNEDAKNKEDYFYAGSLLYALKDYAGAIEKYNQMKDKTDSLGQIANYQTGFSYIKTKNKVAAMDAFKMAAAQDFNKVMQEDAYFNYAKLCFDLNKDGSVFKDYMRKYKTLDKNDLIYSYIALAALYDRDYAGAVEAYDNIDELDNNMRNNYMRANYLRANQLIQNGAYRDAAQNLKVAIYYSDKYSNVNQLAKYWLGESYFRDGDYNSARQTFTDLYNLSALYGKEEGEMIPYNIGYCYFNLKDYDQAIKWFNTYIKQSKSENKKDAMIRIADIDFLRKDYKQAANDYEKAIALDNNVNDIYPYYQAALSYGLTKDINKKIDVLSSVKSADVHSQLYPEAMYELARAYTDIKQDDNAISCYKRIVDAKLDSASTAKSLLGLGVIERNQNNSAQALAYYKRVVNSMPKSEYADDALLAIESIYQTMQEPEEYISYIESLGSNSNKTDADKEQILFNSAEQIFLAENYTKALTTLNSFVEKYPNSANVSMADFYIAECYKNLDNKEKACDYYKKVMNTANGSFTELSALNYAKLSYSMEHYKEAYEGYSILNNVAKIESNKQIAVIGLMSSAYLGKDYPMAIKWADKLIASTNKDLKREAEFTKAKSLLATSNRKDAFAILKNLAKQPSTNEGAEAAYLVIMDNYDRGEFASVEKLVFKFADDAKNQTYWLAKAFIVLGDSYVEQDDFEQARATFESIKNGYTPQNDTDEIIDNVDMRLKKLSEMGK